MLKLLAPLSLLALAAASSAQTFVISPADAKGYTSTYIVPPENPPGNYNGVTASSTHKLKAELATRWSARNIRSTYKTSGFKYGTSYTYNVSYTYSVNEVLGWMGEFELPAPPVGASLMSATLAASIASGSNVATATSTVGIGVYVGDGRVNLGDRTAPIPGYATRSTVTVGPNSLNVMAGLKALPVGAKYAGLHLSEESSFVLTEGNLMLWSSPTLTLVYGYPARTPLSLGNFYGDPTKVPVTYEFRRPGTRTVVVSGTVSPDATGAISPVVPPGTWDVSLKASHWLRRTLKNVTVADGSSTLPPISLVNGDVNGDNVVSAADRAKVTAALGTYLGGPGYDAAADLTGDGYVTAADRAVVTAALGTLGDD